jgi:D-3-phosphoglycerate dehydrogenase / 2-oxoglutarate reductase
LACDNAVITPHAAFYSDTSIAEVEAKATRNVVDVLCGRLPANVVNPAVTHHSNFRLARYL